MDAISVGCLVLSCTKAPRSPGHGIWCSSFAPPVARCWRDGSGFTETTSRALRWLSWKPYRHPASTFAAGGCNVPGTTRALGTSEVYATAHVQEQGSGAAQATHTAKTVLGKMRDQPEEGSSPDAGQIPSQGRTSRQSYQSAEKGGGEAGRSSREEGAGRRARPPVHAARPASPKLPASGDTPARPCEGRGDKKRHWLWGRPDAVVLDHV
mmetsp:Transcript_17275/g.40899  ORF Transcript_17275/g.40899 Transcript_17275/m.40899 type:complete len:210 (+) Transcript_17275:1233-1862(+)